MSDGEAVARYEAMYAAVPEGARAFAAEAWGETWSHAEMGSLLDFARLMAEQDDERFYREYQKAYNEQSDYMLARLLSGRLRAMDKRAKAANQRNAELQAKMRLMRVELEGLRAERNRWRRDASGIETAEPARPEGA